MIPKNLISITWLIRVPYNDIFMGRILRLVNITYTVFSKFKVKRLERSQLEIKFNSRFSCTSIRPESSPVRKKFVSSANVTPFNNVETEHKSLIYIKNNNGPSINLLLT